MVEDDATTRSTIERVLQEDDIHVVGVADADAAVEALCERTFDVILLDHQLPGRTGLALLPELREIDDRPAIVFLTGEGSETVAHRALSRGAVDYHVKDADVYPQLPAIVREAGRTWGSLDHLVTTEAGPGPSPVQAAPEGDDEPLLAFLQGTPVTALVAFDAEGTPVLSTLPDEEQSKLLATRGAALVHQTDALVEATGTRREAGYVLLRGADRVLAVASAPTGTRVLCVLPNGTDADEALGILRRAARLTRDCL